MRISSDPPEVPLVRRGTCSRRSINSFTPSLSPSGARGENMQELFPPTTARSNNLRPILYRKKIFSARRNGSYQNQMFLTSPLDVSYISLHFISLPRKENSMKQNSQLLWLA